MMRHIGNITTPKIKLSACPIFGSQTDASWKTIPVPSNIELHGYGVPRQLKPGDHPEALAQVGLSEAKNNYFPKY